jgi:hypothetical protein
MNQSEMIEAARGEYEADHQNEQIKETKRMICKLGQKFLRLRKVDAVDCLRTQRISTSEDMEESWREYTPYGETDMLSCCFMCGMGFGCRVSGAEVSSSRCVQL